MDAPRVPMAVPFLCEMYQDLMQQEGIRKRVYDYRDNYLLKHDDKGAEENEDDMDDSSQEGQLTSSGVALPN